MAERSNKYFTAFCGGPSAAEYAPQAAIDARRGIIRRAGGIHRAATDGRVRPPLAILPRKETDCHGGKNLSSISGFLEDVRRVIRLQHLSPGSFRSRTMSVKPTALFGHTPFGCGKRLPRPKDGCTTNAGSFIGPQIQWNDPAPEPPQGESLPPPHPGEHSLQRQQIHAEAKYTPVSSVGEARTVRSPRGDNGGGAQSPRIPANKLTSVREQYHMEGTKSSSVKNSAS